MAGRDPARSRAVLRRLARVSASDGGAVDPTRVASAAEPSGRGARRRPAFLRQWRFRLGGRLFRAFLTVGSLTFGVKLASAAKEMAVARWFGRGDDLDAFIIALILPSFAVSIVAGSVQAALIPAYTAVREQEGEAAAHRLFSALWLRSVVGLVAITLVMAVVGRRLLPLVASGFSPAKLDRTYELYLALLPMIVLAGTGTTIAAVLNAEERFARVATVGVVTPILTLTLIVMLGQRLGVGALACGAVGGAAAEAAILYRQLSHCGIRIRPHWRGAHPRLNSALRQYFPVAAGTVVLSGSQLVDQGMAGALAPGSVAALAYGTKIVAVLTGTGAVALSTVMLPRFSTLVAREEWDELRRVLLRAVALVIAAAIPLAAGVALLSRPLVALVFQGGAFSASDTAAVAEVQAMYVLQLPFYAAGILFVRLISALQANQFLIWASLLILVTNAAGDWLFMRWFGVSGIALATSVVQFVTAIFLATVLLHLFARRRLCT